MRENWLLASWAYEKIILVQHMHFQSFFLSTSFHPFFCPLSHVFALCLLAYVPSLSYVFVPFLLSSIPCLKTLSPILCTLSHGSVPCFRTSAPCLSTVPVSPFLWLYSTVPVLCSSISCPFPLSFILARMWVFLKNIQLYMHTLDGWLWAGTVPLTSACSTCQREKV